MADAYGLARPLPSRRPWLGTALRVVAVLGLGVLVGLQYMDPDKRVLAVSAAAVLIGLAWRVDTLTGLGFLVLALPYPRNTVFGSTNLAFILLMLILWLLRVTQRQSAAPARTGVDVPIAGLVLAYVLSFYNIADSESLKLALGNAELFAACVLMFYMVVSNVRTQSDLRRLQTFQMVSLATICLLAVFELTHPGGVFIPGWISFKEGFGVKELQLHNVRVGGPFFDFELLSEFCALSSLTLVFLILRTRELLPRLALGALLLLDIFVLFVTVTRGSVISLGVGLVYLLFRIRKRLRVVPFTIAAATLVAGAALIRFYVKHFTLAGDIGARLESTHFVGLVPDTRVAAWSSGWEKFLEHPIIGHGPYYTMRTGVLLWYWPHNVYLYIANLVGIVGLTFFLWLVFRLIHLSSRSGEDLNDPNYARAFLLIANTQMIVFLFDQVKIDYLRNPVYQFEVWLMFAVLVSAYRVAYPAKPAEPEPAPA